MATEMQKLRDFIKRRYPVGTEVWDSHCSEPYTITKRSVFWVKPWKYEDYNDRMRPENEEDYTVDFLVHAPGKNSVVYFLKSYAKKDCLREIPAITPKKTTQAELVEKWKTIAETFEKRTAYAKEQYELEVTRYKSDLLKEVGLVYDDEVTLEIVEYRDDRVHCFSAAQKATCWVKDIHITTTSVDGGESFLSPTLYTKLRSGKFSKKPVYHNEFCAWKLWKGDTLILSHLPESIIIPGTYTEAKLAEMRVRCAEIQKIA